MMLAKSVGIFLFATCCLLVLTAAAAEYEFRYKAPEAQTAELMSKFNGWKGVSMMKNADGVWTVKVSLSPGTHPYKFLVNGNEWVFDPENPKRETADGIENSAVEITGVAGAATSKPVSIGTRFPSLASQPGISPAGASPAMQRPSASFSTRPGEVTTFQAPLSAKLQADAAKDGNARLRNARVAIVVPQAFDAAKPWPVLVICNTQAYSNIDAMNQFKLAALQEDWVIMAADDVEAEQGKEGGTREACTEAAFDYLAQVWPGVKRWPVATGGMSGGGKNCAFLAAHLAKNGHPVIGMLMMGVNQDMASVALRRERPSGFRQTAVFLSSGKEDTIATPAHHERVKDSLRSNGFRKLRLESFDGAHVVHEPHVSEALRWFVSQASGTGAADPATSPASTFDKFFKKSP